LRKRKKAKPKRNSRAWLEYEVQHWQKKLGQHAQTPSKMVSNPDGVIVTFENTAQLERYALSKLHLAKARLETLSKRGEHDAFEELIEECFSLSSEFITPEMPNEEEIENRLINLRHFSRAEHIIAIAKIEVKFAVLKEIGLKLKMQTLALERRYLSIGDQPASRKLAHVLADDLDELKRKYSPEALERAMLRLKAHQILAHERVRQSPITVAGHQINNPQMRQFKR
jgi:hypothetical protein